MRKNHRKTPRSISQDLLLLWKPPNYGHCHIVQCVWQTGGRVSCNKIRPNDAGDILFNNGVITNKQCSVHLHVHHRFSFCTWCCKTLDYPSHLHPQLPHPPTPHPPPHLQLYVNLTLKVLGVFLLVNFSITWEETLANLCSALTGVKPITFLPKASTTELNDWVHTIITM